MELFLLLPILLGFAAVGMLSDGGANNVNASADGQSVDDDVVVGTNSTEDLSGGAGDDFVLGGRGADLIEGDKDDDLLLGENGSDQIFGGIGYDMILGGAGNDAIYGMKGHDYLIGGAGNDTLIGGAGDDTLIGTTGADKLEGGSGEDLIIGLDAKGSTSVLELNMLGTTAEAEASLKAITDKLTEKYGTANATSGILDRVETAFSVADSNDADDALYGGGNNDTIVADLSDTVTTGEGNDVIHALSGGANEVLTVTDFNPASDKLYVYVPSGTNTAITLVNGTSQEAGVSVVIAGDTVAVLKGLLAANIAPGSIVASIAQPDLQANF